MGSRCQHLLFCFLPALSLHCCAQAFSSCCEEGLLFLAMCGLLSEVAFLADTGSRSQASAVAAHGLRSVVQGLGCSMAQWAFPRPALCIVRQIPNRWTTREVCQCLLKLTKAWELFGGPVIRTWCILCWALGLIPG